jgi:peptidylprolyl isomerase/peptidyl-prolyl cis-trans isomerase B (cyclophilin B)
MKGPETVRIVGAGFIFAAMLLTGCDHHKRASQAQTEAGSAAVAQNDSALTGQPPPAPSSSDNASPQAKPVGPLSESSPAAVNPPSENEVPKPDASSNTAPETPAMASSTPPSDATATPSAAPAATSSPEPAPVTVATPPSDSSTPGSEAIQTQEQVVVLQTSLGRIVIAMDDFAAPKTCENFRKLVSDGFYNHTAFHRVIPNFIIQGGDPNSKSDDRASYGQGGPGYTLPPEIKLRHDRGAVAMARLPDSVNPQRESNGSQFYICLAPCPSLDDQYTVFGHVIKGMDIATQIATQSRDKHDNPLDRITMEASLESKDKAFEDASTVNP